MWGIAGRSLGAFFFATVLLRLAGRKSVSQLNYLDFLMANMMGGLMGIYIAGSSKGAQILLAPAAIIAAGVFTERATVKNRTARKLLQGQSLVIIKNGKIIEKNMAQSHYNTGELLMALRKKGVFDLGEVEFAVLELDGSVSVQKKSQHRPVTPKDLNISTQYEGLTSVLISDGKVLDQNLKNNHLDQNWLKNELHKLGIQETNKVFLATLASDGSLYVDLKNDF